MICLDWYDWNLMSLSTWLKFSHCRDWSVWIGTIETYSYNGLLRGIRTQSGLICLDWYDWNTHIIPPLHRVILMKSGLICLDWYDWNRATISSDSTNIIVGIDLFGLIRLKLDKCIILPNWLNTCRDWSVWIDTIETLLLCLEFDVHTPRRDWSVWIDTIETLFHRIEFLT